MSWCQRLLAHQCTLKHYCYSVCFEWQPFFFFCLLQISLCLCFYVEKAAVENVWNTMHFQTALFLPLRANWKRNTPTCIATERERFQEVWVDHYWRDAWGTEISLPLSSYPSENLQTCHLPSFSTSLNLTASQLVCTPDNWRLQKFLFWYPAFTAIRKCHS